MLLLGGVSLVRVINIIIIPCGACSEKSHSSNLASFEDGFAQYIVLTEFHGVN